MNGKIVKGNFCDWGYYENEFFDKKQNKNVTYRAETVLDRCCPCGKAPAFWSVNWAAALAHLFNTVLTFIFWAVDDNKDDVFRLSEEYAPWIPTINTTLNTTLNTTGPAICPVSENRIFQISKEWCIERETALTSTLSLWWLVIVFHFLSFAFQAFTMFDWKCNVCTKKADTAKGWSFHYKRYDLEVVEDGTNILRMIEYSISATLMQISIALVLGIWQRLVIVGIALLTVATMLFGLIAEQIKTYNIALAWVSHFSGWLTMLGVWGIIGRQFYFTIEKSTNAPPEFVYIIVIVIGALYSVFGLVQLVQLALYTSSNENNPEVNKAVEMAYCLNSLISKTFLGWMIFANALTGMAKS